MESLVSFSKWLSKWFTVAVILWAAFNYALPATSSWVIPNTAYLLGLILFGMGLTLTTEDFKRIAKRPIPVVLGTVAHYVIMPGLAWLLCMIFHLKGATAAGVILVGSCPSGTSSSVMAFLSGGDVALDVSIETLSTLLAPLMIPTLLSFLAGQYVSVPAQSLFLSTLRIVVVPIILGVLAFDFTSRHPLDCWSSCFCQPCQYFHSSDSPCHSSRYAPQSLWLCPWFWIFKNPWFGRTTTKSHYLRSGDARLKSWSNPCHEIFRATSCHPINYLQYLAQYLRFHPLIMVEEPFKKQLVR